MKKITEKQINSMSDGDFLETWRLMMLEGWKRMACGMDFDFTDKEWRFGKVHSSTPTANEEVG